MNKSVFLVVVVLFSLCFSSVVFAEEDNRLVIPEGVHYKPNVTDLNNAITTYDYMPYWYGVTYVKKDSGGKMEYFVVGSEYEMVFTIGSFVRCNAKDFTGIGDAVLVSQYSGVKPLLNRDFSGYFVSDQYIDPDEDLVVVDFMTPPLVKGTLQAEEILMTPFRQLVPPVMIMMVGLAAFAKAWTWLRSQLSGA